MNAFHTLGELAESDRAVTAILQDGKTGHYEAADLINAGLEDAGNSFRTTESSVRRWRGKHDYKAALPPVKTVFKALAIDIETRPALAHLWNLWGRDFYISPQNVAEHIEMICFAAKWLGEPSVGFWSQWEHGQDGMIRSAWELMNEADVILHFNGKSFDVPHLNREFVRPEWRDSIGGPPAPYQTIDLRNVVKKVFRFEHNSLQATAQYLGVGSKVKNDGFQLWLDVMRGVKKAQRQMKLYNIQDVQLLEDMYGVLRPWIPQHPNAALYTGRDDVCSKCSSENVVEDGTVKLSTGLYQGWRCQDCGGRSRSVRRLMGVQIREANLT